MQSEEENDTPGCTRGHGSAPPTAAWPRAYAGGGPWSRIPAFGLPMAGRRPRMTRAHDGKKTDIQQTFAGKIRAKQKNSKMFNPGKRSPERRELTCDTT